MDLIQKGKKRHCRDVVDLISLLDYKHFFKAITECK